MEKLRPLALFCVSLVVVMAGCSGGTNHQDLSDYIAETKRRPTGQIDPLPSFRPYRAFTYSAMTMRSPFDPPVEEKKRTVAKSNMTVKPDLAREKEYLESFNLSSLAMVGTLKKSGILWALISDGQGGVHRVTEGNYLGKNHGKIVAANNAELSLVEIVSDGLEGWLERPRTIKLQEKE